MPRGVPSRLVYGPCGPLAEAGRCASKSKRERRERRGTPSLQMGPASAEAAGQHPHHQESTAGWRSACEHAKRSGRFGASRAAGRGFGELRARKRDRVVGRTQNASACTLPPPSCRVGLKRPAPKPPGLKVISHVNPGRLHSSPRACACTAWSARAWAMGWTRRATSRCSGRTGSIRGAVSEQLTPLRAR